MISRLPKSPMPKKVVRAAFVSALVASATMMSSPAFAKVYPDDGDDPGTSLSTLNTVLIFGAIPIGLFILISLVVSLPSIMKAPRYRPGKGWQGAPEWYGAPESDKGGELTGSSQSALTGTIVTPDEADADGGGTSAHW